MWTIENERAELLLKLAKLRRRVRRHPRLASHAEAIMWRIRELGRLADAARRAAVQTPAPIAIEPAALQRAS